MMDLKLDFHHVVVFGPVVEGMLLLLLLHHLFCLEAPNVGSRLTYILVISASMTVCDFISTLIG